MNKNAFSPGRAGGERLALKETPPSVRYFAPQDSSELPRFRSHTFVVEGPNNLERARAELSYHALPETGVYVLDTLQVRDSLDQCPEGAALMQALAVFLRKKGTPGALKDAAGSLTPSRAAWYEKFHWHQSPDFPDLFLFEWPRGVAHRGALARLMELAALRAAPAAHEKPRGREERE